jgi:GT2 family glycosyltransferase
MTFTVKEKIGQAIVNPRGIWRKLSIVIPIFNKWNFTKSCLKDLIRLPDDHEVIIIDNGSSDETNKELVPFCNELLGQNPNQCWIRCVQNTENTFHSKACNQGYKMANGDNILFLNNDVKVRQNHTDWTKVITDACASTNGLVGPTMGQLDKDLNFVKEANEQLTGNSYLGGWCIAAKKDVWKQLDVDGTDQIWNEEFPFYFNDTDLSFRARKKQIPLTVVSLPDIVHFGKISAAQINIPKLYKEGRQVFVKKWGNR